jgi:short-subunit dehydrogenase
VVVIRENKMKKVIIIGATSGIGKELGIIFDAKGYETGITGRRIELLNELQAQLSGKAYVAAMDIRNTEESIKSLENLITTMGGMDILIINAGTGHINPSLDWAKEKETIETNVVGFTALATAGMQYFIKKGSGHLVGVSSIAGIRGSDIAPAYNASKTFISKYLEGISRKVVKEKLNIAITDIQPGFVDTAMAKGDKKFWMASPKKAAEQVYEAILKKKRIAYITKRWRLIAWLLKGLPGYLYLRI